MGRQRDCGNARNARVTAWHGRISHEEWALCKSVHQRLCPLSELFFENSCEEVKASALGISSGQCLELLGLELGHKWGTRGAMIAQLV